MGTWLAGVVANGFHLLASSPRTAGNKTCTNSHMHKFQIQTPPQVLLDLVRMWLSGIAYGFYLLASFLRVVGNGLSAVGGLMAFTVVFSVGISVLSALTFLVSR